MRLPRLALSAAALLAFAGAAHPGAPTFKETLAEARKEAGTHKKLVRDSRTQKGIRLLDVLMAHSGVKTRLKRPGSGYFVSKECGLYVEKKAAAAAAWTLEEPPDLKKADVVAERARDPELVATLGGTGVVLFVDCFSHVSVTNTTGKEFETYPFPGIDRTVDCRDVKAMLQAHLDQWRKGCAETSGEAAPAKKPAGIAKWSAALTGKSGADAAPERREWYAWEGEPFHCLHAGATFVATATYTGAAVTDAKAAQQVKELLGVLRPVLE